MKRNTSCRNIAKMYIHEYGLRGYIQNHLTLSLKYVFTWLEEQVFMYKSMWNIFENTCANNVCKYMCKYICIRKYMCKAQIKCLQKFWNWPLLMYIVCTTRACLSIMVFLSGILEEDCKYLVSCVTYQMSYAVHMDLPSVSRHVSLVSLGMCEMSPDIYHAPYVVCIVCPGSCTNGKFVSTMSWFQIQYHVSFIQHAIFAMAYMITLGV